MDPKAMRHPEKSEQLLEAAHRVVMEHGIARMTIEQVAREAGVSKGAVLHYFPNKNALIAAMLRMFMEWAEARQAEQMAQDTQAPGRFLRAFIRGCNTEKGHEGRKRSGAGMLAAIANDPQLLGILRERAEASQQQAENDGIDPALATTIRLAVDGMILTEILGLAPPSGALREQVIARLLAMATPPAPVPT